GDDGPDGLPPELLFCENESNAARLWGAPTPASPYPKDGINDHVVNGASTVNPALEGTKAALRYHCVIGSGETAEIRLRLADDDAERPHFGELFERVLAERQEEAD